MNTHIQIKYLHEGQYVAEVEVELTEEAGGWSPYLSLTEAYRLDDIRQALRQGDLKTASKQARLFIMQPIVA